MADLSPLEFDKDTIKEFGITDKTEPNKDWKTVFIQGQIDELQKLSWRTRIDLIHSEKLSQSPNETLAEKARQNRLNGRNDLKQFITAIETLQTLLEEMTSGQTGSNPTK